MITMLTTILITPNITCKYFYLYIGDYSDFFFSFSDLKVAIATKKYVKYDTLPTKVNAKGACMKQLANAMIETARKNGILYLAFLTTKNSKGVKFRSINFNVDLDGDCSQFCFSISSTDAFLLYIFERVTLSLSASLRDKRLSNVIMENTGTKA